MLDRNSTSPDKKYMLVDWEYGFYSSEEGFVPVQGLGGGIVIDSSFLFTKEEVIKISKFNSALRGCEFFWVNDDSITLNHTYPILELIERMD